MNTRRFLTALLIGIMLLPFGLGARKDKPPTTREMNLINWQEFQAYVPEQIETVLLPVGTVEPHGVIPNGSDNLAPEAMARAIANELNALIAPTLYYGVTGAMKAFPGACAISPEAYRPFVVDILRSLARNGFMNIIILNGHGGPQTPLLQQATDAVSEQQQVRILLVNWWSLVSEDTYAVFGNKGGHAGNNETAYIQAVVPDYIHPERYSKDMATANPTETSWHAAPFPSSIGLYEAGQGYPTFDPQQARTYFERVNKRVLALILDVITKWDQAGLYRGER